MHPFTLNARFLFHSRAFFLETDLHRVGAAVGRAGVAAAAAAVLRLLMVTLASLLLMLVLLELMSGGRGILVVGVGGAGVLAVKDVLSH